MSSSSSDEGNIEIEPYSKREEWKDVKPIEQVIQVMINYSLDLNYFIN